MTLPYRFNPLGLTQWVPVSGTRGVFITSGATVIQSAMTITGGTIGTDYPGNRMDVYSKGRAVDTVVSSGGSMTISSGGVASVVRVTSGGIGDVFSGGFASDVETMELGGSFRASGGVISGFKSMSYSNIMRDGAVVYEAETISQGQISVLRATINGITMSGGVVSAGAGAVISGGLIYNGNPRISAGATATGLVLGSLGRLAVLSGGTCFDTTVSSGGSAIVSFGGIASNFSSIEGATVNILSGGSATTNGTAYGVSVESGGALTVESGGVLNIQSGKTAYGLTVSGGGFVSCYTGSVVADGFVIGGGTYQTRCSISTTGHANINNVVCSAYGYVVLTGGGTATSCTFEKNGYIQVYFGSAFDCEIKSGGVAMIGAGVGRINNTTISSGGLMAITSGTALAPTVLNGGTLTVSAGSALEVVNEPDAVINSQTGATVTYAQPIASTQGVFTSSGTTPVASAMVISGGTIGNGYEATRYNVYSRGRVIDVTTIASGNIILSAGGYASGCALLGGTLVVSGGCVAERCYTEVGVPVYADGIVRNCSGGAGFFVANSGTIVDACVVSGSCVIHVRGGRATNCSIASGGKGDVSSGITSNTTVYSGGSMTVRSGGLADVTDVKSGGKMIVSSGGLALNVTAENPANVVVLDGGTIYPPIG